MNLPQTVFGISVMAGYMIMSAALAQEIVEVDAQVSVNLADKDLVNKLSIQNASFQRRGPAARVEVNVFNNSTRPVPVKYIAEWYDEAGSTVRTNARWEAIQIDGSLSRTIDIIETSKSATRVVVNIKSAK